MAIDRYKEKMRKNIITEYEPRFCDMYIEYAQNNLNPNGFWGKYLIDESVKQHWIDTYPEFKRTVALVPNITAEYLNEAFSELVKIAYENKDAKMATQLLLKALDVQFKIDKDAGAFKEAGKERNNIKKSNNNTLNPQDVDSMKNYMGTLSS